MPINASWSMSLQCFIYRCERFVIVQHLSLVGFVVIVVISLTLRMPRYRCVSEVFDYPCVVTVWKREKAERALNCHEASEGNIPFV